MFRRLPSTLQRCKFIATPALRSFPVSTATEVNLDQKFTFPEEPLGLPASECFGWFQGKIGQRLGPLGRYEILQKLGYGTTSNVWLAKDTIGDRHVTLKILSGYASQLNAEFKLQEADIYRRLSKVPPNNHCSRLLDEFVHPGIEADGEHTCLVLDVMRGTLADTMDSIGAGIPVNAAKHVIKNVLTGLAYLHENGIAHTDLKVDNIMISAHDLPPTAIDDWLKRCPPQFYSPPSLSLNNKMVTTIVSQKFDSPAPGDISQCRFIVSDLSSAQVANDQTTDDITPLSLRPPEVMLWGEWNEKVDIWTFGCLVFHLLTKNDLFRPTPQECDAELGFTVREPSQEFVLFLQSAVCGPFPPKLLQRCRNSHKYFNQNCSMIGHEKRFTLSLEYLVRDLNPSISDEDLVGSVDLMKKCFRLLAEERPTATELLHHPWLLM